VNWIATSIRSQYISDPLAPITFSDNIFLFPNIIFTAKNKTEAAKNVDMYDAKM
jgi:hypothetical protein